MKNMAESIRLPKTMKEVVDFIEKWFKRWLGAYSVVWDGLTTESFVAAKHILAPPHKDKVIELWRNVDEFRERFVVDLMAEVRVGQGLVSMIIFIIWLVWTMISATIADGVSNIQHRLFLIPDQFF